MKSYKILIIDDDEFVINYIIDLIEDNYPNYTFHTATDGQKGLDLAEKIRPDIVLTDWEMNEMNGIDTIKKIKANPKIKDTPVIMITGKMMSSDNLKHALESGAVDFISKPIEKVELEARVNSALITHQYFLEKIRTEQLNASLIKENFEVKMRQLLQVNFQIEKRNKALESIQQSFDNALATLKYSSKEFEVVNTALKSQFNQEEDWKNFLNMFNELDTDFLNILSRKFPNLTQYDIKVCAYIKLGMDTNQLSKVLGINLESTKKSRKRIRKKLNIEPEIDFFTFLQSL